MCELASAMVMDRSTLAIICVLWSATILVVLRQARHDRRKRYVELTAKGKSLLPRARQLWRRAEDRFERIFGKDPAAELRAVLLDIANNRDLAFTAAALRFSIDTIQCGVYIFNLGYMP